MSKSYSDQQLQAFLDEALPAEMMAQIESQMRSDGQLVSRLMKLVGQREAGVHGLGEIWRRHRLSCPSRQHLGSFLLGTLDEEYAQYIRFHIEHVNCRLCCANLDDLKNEQSHLQSLNDSVKAAQAKRRRKYFQSSAGYLQSDV